MHSQDKSNPLQSERSVKLQKLTTGRSNLKKIQKIIKPLIRPLRIFQFLVVLLIFALVIYATALNDEKVSSVICILLTVLSGAYVFILAVDIISQLSGGELQSIPMFLFSFFGMILFGVAGILLIPVYSASALWTILTVLCLSFLMSVFFILDVVTALVFWKRNCDVCNDPYCTNQAQILYQKKDICHPACTETVKFDLMTSVSSIKIPSGDEEAVPDHSYRKIGYGRRRQYVDRPASARSAAMVEVADIQTEPSVMYSIQSQTHREIKEMPVQTVSKCELCNRQIPIFPTSTDPMHRAMQQSPCSTCPALMQLIRGAPCCPGCRCVTGIIQVSQQTQQQQTPRQEKPTEQKLVKETKHWQQPVDEKSYEIVTTDQKDPNVKGKSGTITKLTLASYSVTSNQTTDNSSQTITEKGVKNSRKSSSDSEEVRKSRPDSEKNDKEKVKETPKKLNETLIPEKEKAKSTNNPGRKLSKSNPKKHPESINMKSTEAEKKLTETDPKIAEATVEKLTSNSEKSAKIVNAGGEAVEVVSKKNLLQKAASEPGPQEGSKMNNRQSQKISMSLPETKHLISPPRLVAEMIDRLQEIEGNKHDTPMLTASEITKAQPSILNPTKSEYDGKERNLTIEMNSARGVAFDRSVDENRKSTFKSEESALESSNLTVDSSKVLPYQKVSRDSSASYGYSDKQILKPHDDRQELNKVERSSESIVIPNPHTGTQTSDAEIATTSSRYKRTYVFPKKNKIEPAEVTHTDIDVQTLGYEAQSEKSFTENSQILQEKSLGICSACRRVQLPTTTGSFNYYSVYKNKRGRYYCEFCATPNSIKVLYKDGNEPKRLKCAGCGNFIRSKYSYNLPDELSVRNKLDNCPKCGQSQVQVSPVSSY